MTIVTTLGKGAKTAALTDMKNDKDMNITTNNEVIENYFREDVEVTEFVNSFDDVEEFVDMDTEWFLD